MVVPDTTIIGYNLGGIALFEFFSDKMGIKGQFLEYWYDYLKNN